MALCQLAKEQAGLAGQLANWSLLLAKRPDLSHGIGYAIFRPLILSALQLQRIFVVFILVAKLEEKTCFGLLFYDGFFNEALIRTLYSTVLAESVKFHSSHLNSSFAEPKRSDSENSSMILNFGCDQKLALKLNKILIRVQLGSGSA